MELLSSSNYLEYLVVGHSRSDLDLREKFDREMIDGIRRSMELMN